MLSFPPFFEKLSIFTFSAMVFFSAFNSIARMVFFAQGKSDERAG
jgi:hypothetical protein